jgi:hypothetical protein
MNKKACVNIFVCLKKSAQPGMKTGDWKNQRRISSVKRISTCKKKNKK